MAYPFIASFWFTKGPRQGPINKIVLHTIECPCEPGWAKKAAEIFAKSTATKVSAHYYVDPSAIIQGVRETDIAYAAPGANSDGIQIEQAGRAFFTLAQWTDANGQGLIKQTSSLLADLSSRYNIPLRFCSAAAMLADTNARGVTTHAEVNKAYHRSDHTDPGKNYPLDLVLIEARALLNPPVVIGGDTNPPTPIPEDDHMPAKLIRKTSTGAIEVYANGVAAPFHWADPNDAVRNVATIGRLAKAGLVEEKWIELDDDAFDAIPRLVP